MTGGKNVDELLALHRSHPSEAVRGRLLTAFFPYFQAFPRFVFASRDEDLHGEFLVDAVKTFDRCLASWDPGRASFRTLLSTALRRTWLEIRFKRRASDHETSLEAIEDGNGDAPGVAVATWLDEDPLERTDRDENLRTGEAVLEGVRNEKTRWALRLFDWENFTPALWAECGRAADREPAETARFVEALAESGRVLRARRAKLESALGGQWRRILRLQEKLARNPDEEGDKTRAALRELEELREQALERYRGVKITPPVPLIAEFLKIDARTVYDQVAWLRKKRAAGRAE